jgi:hypothetical protein
MIHDDEMILYKMIAFINLNGAEILRLPMHKDMTLGEIYAEFCKEMSIDRNWTRVNFIHGTDKLTDEILQDLIENGRANITPIVTIKRACSSSGGKSLFSHLSFPLLEVSLLCIVQSLHIEAVGTPLSANSQTLGKGI